MAGGEKQSLTPKEIIHQKFGVKASYRIEEVHASTQNDCPGLAVPQELTCLYRCHLQLPDFSVVSNVFKKKKDSEQSAAELALEKLCIHHRDNDDITVDEAWDDIVERIKYIFSDEFLSADHPLGCHLRATLQRDGDRFGSVPVSVISTFDAKIFSRCKVINPSVDSDPILAMSYVMKAAAKLPDCIVVSPSGASLRRKNPYPSAIIEALDTHAEHIKFEAVRIQCTTGGEEVVELVTLDILSGRYYLDSIAEKLGLKDGSQVMISRTIGKTSSGYECRVYSAIPKWKSSDNSWKAHGKRPVAESSHLEKSQNAKASFVSGQDIHGDAIVASVGYPWRSHHLEHGDVTLKSFDRICCGISPNGIYKFSRQALIAAQLPFSFTTKSTWRGPLPREILCMFCRQQQLAEPIITISTAPVNALSDILRIHKKLKDSESDDTGNQCRSRKKKEIPGSGTVYRCEVKILSKSQDLVLDCSPGNLYEKESHAIQNASLKALSWFNRLFDDLDADPEQPCYSNEHLDMLFQRSIMMKGSFPSSRRFEQPTYRSSRRGMHRDQKRVQSITNGSLMSVGQYACFQTNKPADCLLLAAATDTVRTRSLLSGHIAGLEYTVRLLGVKGPSEKRMEETFFKPPLSKQRVEYAMKHMKESSASTLVDFGCGSGSLLASVLDYPTSLQTIVRVDISQKDLACAAKMLHSELNKGACNLKSTVLYDGSTLEVDSRLHDMDIGTCLEVIEHMEEDQACQFGDTVLSLFCPKLLIVSTPNYEYNKILYKSAAPGHPKEKSMSQLPKFRNHDHKFEWTRKQFNQWASTLAKRHNYNVEFSGVGGPGKADHGFASQIAVFRRQSLSGVKKVLGSSMQPYKVIWEWTRGDGDKRTNL